jgi:arsenite methyltransferase
MTNYLNETFDLSDQNLISIFDEFPIWSSYFGVRMLDMVNYKTRSTVLDIGCGAGFPLVELAQRLGSRSKVFGIDIWTPAWERINLKLKTMNLKNVTFLNQPAENLPFRDNTFDLIVSNNGINNVSDPQRVLTECCRTIKPGGQFLMSVNLPGTMTEFYGIFRKVLGELNLNDEIIQINTHINSKRKSLDENSAMIRDAGLIIKDVIEDCFFMRYADGTAFLNHYFIKMAFLDSWKKIPPEKDLVEVFEKIETYLNALASENGHLKLSVPFVVFNCSR